MDVSKYFTKIISLDKHNKTIRLQPGVIRDELNDYLLSIYPNPVIDHFTVDLSGEDGEYTIEILNSEMQKVIEKSGAVNEVLNVNFNQPSGMYFVKISINDNSYYNIIINQK